MTVVIKLFASLRNGRFKIKELELPEGTCVLDVLNLLKLESSQVAIVRVNGKSANDDYVLQEADQLALFPPMGGG